MKIALAVSVAIILMGESDNFVIENKQETIAKGAGQKILLRKLQNFQQNNSRDTKTVTWNEILADVLVNKINIFSNNGIQRDTAEKPKQNILKKCFSEILYLYKIYVYDKLNAYDNIVVPRRTVDDNDPTADNDLKDDEQPADENHDPKSEVEIIVPAYHGKLEENTTEGSGIERTDTEDCEEGFLRNEEDNCVEAKYSQFITYIPRQCPIGFKRDRLGFCRMVF